MTVEAGDIARGSGVAVWAQIADRLRSEIVGGSHRPGAPLPTETELAARFGVNRHTVRRAMRALVEGGLIRVEQGRGSFVSENVLDYAVGRRTRFSESLSTPESMQTRVLLFAEKVRADQTIAQKLDLGFRASLWRLELLGQSSGRPISVASHYFAVRRFPDLPNVYARCGSISRALTEMGVPDYTRRWTRVTAILPDAGDAEHLQQPRTRPVLRTESVNVDAAGEPIEFGRARFAADRVQLLVGAES